MKKKKIIRDNGKGSAMKLSTKGRYGLRAMVELAARQGGDPVSLAVIAAEQGVSEAYLEQLMRAMKNAGLLQTARGKAGGYRLAKPAEQISVGAVLRALEGSTAIADCVDGGGSVCENACTCAARPLFLTLQTRIDAVLQETTVADLCSDYLSQKERMRDARIS